MDKFLITNSDDFGINKSVTDAIIDTHLNGIMTSTTIMLNMPGTDYAISKAKEYPGLGVGIHFNLTEGAPLTEASKIPDLINKHGFFNPNNIQRKNFIWGKNKIKQIKLELKNQLEYLLDNGIVPTHYDSHHHITGTPLAMTASIEVAKQFKVNKARTTNIDFIYTKECSLSHVSRLIKNARNLPKGTIHKLNKRKLNKNNIITPDTKILPGRVLPNSSSHIEQFIRTLDVLKPGYTEISFHPGYKDSRTEDSKKTAALRVRDLEVANSKQVIEHIRKNNIKLINFKDLR